MWTARSLGDASVALPLRWVSSRLNHSDQDVMKIVQKFAWLLRLFANLEKPRPDSEIEPGVWPTISPSEPPYVQRSACMKAILV